MLPSRCSAIFSKEFSIHHSGLDFAELILKAFDLGGGELMTRLAERNTPHEGNNRNLLPRIRSRYGAQDRYQSLVNGRQLRR